MLGCRRISLGTSAKEVARGSFLVMCSDSDLSLSAYLNTSMLFSRILSVSSLVEDAHVRGGFGRS